MALTHVAKAEKFFFFLGGIKIQKHELSGAAMFDEQWK